MHDLASETYKITNAAGVGANLVVVQGTNEYESKLPTVANDDEILGVTTERQLTQNKQVRVQYLGIARVKASGVIAVGSTVNIDGTSGKVKAVNEGVGVLVNALGQALQAATADGDIIDVLLNFDKYQIS